MRSDATIRRFGFRFLQQAIDVAVLLIAYAAAWLMRFDGALPAWGAQRLMMTAPFVVVLQYAILSWQGVPRFSWRYVGLREVTRIALASLAATALLAMLRVGLALCLPYRSELGAFELGALIVPWGVLCIDGAWMMGGIVGVRVLRRLVSDRRLWQSRRVRGDATTPVLLIGAGQAGLLVAQELSRRPELGLQVVGFIDDDPLKQGTTLHGSAVLGTTAQLPAAVQKSGAKQALVTIANAPGIQLRRIAERCEQAHLPPKIIPGLYELVGSNLNLSNIRGVRIEDLLRREPVQLDREAIRLQVQGKVVLITGAGGSIGAELARQVAQFAPAHLLLVERAETSLFHIHRELRHEHAELPVQPLIADITDVRRMRGIFAARPIDVVFHAAAYKHVPLMEAHPAAAVLNNVIGTQVVAQLADEHRVGRFVLISTDKAVNPSSIMGTTKRIAEILVQALSQGSATRFVAVRFGNVLGSAGSVVPIFQEQIAAGGPVTVTDPEMRRYFMTIPEACQLVMQAAVLGQGGEIFILDMGEPVKIVDLARDLITLSGLRPERDIGIEFVGLRPGEKLVEELSVAEENATQTSHPKIFVGRLRVNPWSKVAKQLAELRVLAEGEAAELLLRAKMRALVPESNLAGLSATPLPSEHAVTDRTVERERPRSATLLS